MRTHRTKYQLLKHLASQQWLKEYASFLYYKSFFANSTYYAYNYSKIGRIVGQSRWKVKRRIDFFLERGWCREHHNNLTFIAPEKILSEELGLERSLTFTIKGNTEKEIQDCIYALLLELRITQCKYAYLKKVDADNVHKLSKDQRRSRAKPYWQVLSNSALKDIWGLTPQHIVKKLESKGLLQVFRPKVEFLGRYFEKEDSHLPGRFFVSKGKLFNRPPNMLMPLTTLTEKEIEK